MVILEVEAFFNQGRVLVISLGKMSNNSIPSLTRNHMSYTTSRVFHVATKARDEVAVKVKNSLSGGFTAVHADVVAIWSENTRN